MKRKKEDLDLDISFYLLFYLFFALIGSGVTILNNINEIVISLEDVPSHSTFKQVCRELGRR